MTKKQDILSSVCVLPMFFSEKCSGNGLPISHLQIWWLTCHIYLVCPSTACHQNNIHNTTQLYWPQSSMLWTISFSSWVIIIIIIIIIEKDALMKNSTKFACLVFSLDLVLITFLLSLTPNKTTWTTVSVRKPSANCPYKAQPRLKIF